jgi:hemerythrin
MPQKLRGDKVGKNAEGRMMNDDQNNGCAAQSIHQSLALSDNSMINSQAVVEDHYSRKTAIMEKIIWNESLSVGVAEIDRQHKQLVDILNQLLGMDGVTVDSETISDTLTRMTDYADYHFKSEEGFMQKYAYPDYATHRREHIAFMRKTAELAMGTMVYRKTVPTDMLEYLKTWLVEHILVSDMKYKQFFNQKGIH